VNNLPAEARVSRKGGSVEFREGRGNGNRTGEVVVGDVEQFERGLVERRERAGEVVGVEAEGDETVEESEPNRDRTGEIVVGEGESEEAVEEKKRGGEGTGEVVVVEEEGLEVGERGEIGDGPVEGVVAEAHDAELVQFREGVRREWAAQAHGLDDEADHSPLCALHALPLAVVVRLVESVEEPVVLVRFPFKRQQPHRVGGHRGATAIGEADYL